MNSFLSLPLPALSYPIRLITKLKVNTASAWRPNQLIALQSNCMTFGLSNKQTMDTDGYSARASK